MHKMLALLAAVAALPSLAHAAPRDVRITEWMYNGLATGSVGEFVEFTNRGTTAVNFASFSFDDDSRTPGSTSLAAFGLVAAGESVILTDATAATFRTNWGLAATVKVIGGNTNNLARSDEINLFDGTTLIDRLTYNDQDGAGPRTQNVSGRPTSAAALGANNDALWVLSVVGDIEGARTSGLGEVGSPGTTSFAAAALPVPEPASIALLLGAIGLGAGLRRRT